jgi:Ca2+-binding RTX toxin-like protein
MATVQAYQSVDMLSPNTWYGYVTTANASQITLNDFRGNYANYYGSFQYSGDSVSGGVLTSYNQYTKYAIQFLVTGFSVPAVAAYNIIESGDAQAAWRLVLSGNDIINGSSTTDVLAGFAGNDQFNGGAGSDTGFGGSGNDLLIYSSGKDLFYGEEGFDVVQLGYAQSAFTVTRIDPATFLVKQNGSTDSVTVNTVERLDFLNNQVTALDVGAGQDAGEAYRMYQAAFNRTPDNNGLASWINFLDQGGAPLTMAQQFINSQEFQATYGSLDNTAFVQLMYNNVLHRNGEAAGVAAWVNGLNNGLTRAQVLYGFSESAENIANVAPAIANGIKYTEWWLN